MNVVAPTFLIYNFNFITFRNLGEDVLQPLNYILVSEYRLAIFHHEDEVIVQLVDRV